MTALPSPAFSTWPAGRKVAAVAFGLAGYAVLGAAAVYLSGALFLVLNKAHPVPPRWASIIAYWQAYAGDPPLRRKLQLSITVSALGLLVLLPASLAAAARPHRSLHGDARFASRAEIRRAGLHRGGGPAILVGRVGKHLLALPGQLSVLLAAPTRSGKGVSVVIPNLLNWPDSVVTLDIKGENFDATAGFRVAQGQQVFAFSPFDDEGRSHRWNPLSAVRADARHRVGDLLAIGQVLYPNDGSGTPSEAFFHDQARNLFLGLGLLLLETPALPRTMGEMLRQSSGKGRPVGQHLRRLIAARKQAGRPYTPACTDALGRTLNNSDNTLSSVVATFVAPLTLFADPVVDAATSADDFQLKDLRRTGLSIYLRMPPGRLADARPLLQLFYAQLLKLNTDRLPSQDPSLRYQCLLINDEFPVMGRLGTLVTSAAFLAGYNLRLLTVVQAMSQLDAVYSDKEARTFATNHGLQVLFAPREQRDAEEYSAMLGDFTATATSRGRSRSVSAHGHSSTSSSESAQRRALLLPQEFKALGPDRLVVIVENCRPILGEKICYHQDRTFRARVLPPPVVPVLDAQACSASSQRCCTRWLRRWRTTMRRHPRTDASPMPARRCCARP